MPPLFLFQTQRFFSSENTDLPAARSSPCGASPCRRMQSRRRAIFTVRYPTGNIRILVPIPAGGAPDIAEVRLS